MPEQKKIKVPVSGSVEPNYKITGAGEEQHLAIRRAVAENKAFTRQSFEEALRQASRQTSEPESRKNGTSE